MKRSQMDPGMYPDSPGLVHDLNHQNQTLKNYLGGGANNFEGEHPAIVGASVFSDITRISLLPQPWKDNSQKLISAMDLLFVIHSPVKFQNETHTRRAIYAKLSKLNQFLNERHKESLKDWRESRDKYGFNDQWEHPMDWVNKYSSVCWENGYFREQWESKFFNQIKPCVYFQIPYYVRKFIKFVGVVELGTTSSLGGLSFLHNPIPGSMTSLVVASKGSVDVLNFWGPDVQQFDNLWIVFKRVLKDGPISAIPVACPDYPTIDEIGYYKNLDEQGRKEFLEHGSCLKIGKAVGNFENIQASESVVSMCNLTHDGKVSDLQSTTYARAHFRAWISCGHE